MSAGEPRTPVQVGDIREHAARVAEQLRQGSLDPFEALRRSGEIGLCGLYAPAAHGGSGLGFGDVVPVFETVGRENASYAFMLSVQNTCAAAVGRLSGNDQQAEWAREMCSGAAGAAFLVTEKHGGSDPAHNRTTLTPEGGAYRLTGEKVWATLAPGAEFLIVLCAVPGSMGPVGSALVIVPASVEGLEVGSPYELAVPGLPVCDVRFDNVRLLDQHVLAGPGRGFKEAMHGLDGARLSVAAAAVGLAVKAREQATRFLGGRANNDGPLLENQGLQFPLVDSATETIAARALCAWAAEKAATPQRSVAIAHAKRFCCDIAVKVCTIATSAMGAEGIGADGPHSLLDAALLLRTVDGTPEIQRVIIGRELLRQAGAT